MNPPVKVYGLCHEDAIIGYTGISEPMIYRNCYLLGHSSFEELMTQLCHYVAKLCLKV